MKNEQMLEFRCADRSKQDPIWIPPRVLQITAVSAFVSEIKSSRHENPIGRITTRLTPSRLRVTTFHAFSGSSLWKGMILASIGEKLRRLSANNVGAAGWKKCEKEKGWEKGRDSNKGPRLTGHYANHKKD